MQPMKRTVRDESGVALVLALIFGILLYVIVAELVVSGRMIRFTGENDATLARMRNHMDFTFHEVESMLLDDLAGQSAQGGSGGAGGNLGAAMQGQGGGQNPDGSSGDAADPSASCDSSRDAWAKPQAFADSDITTYVFVEPENQKFNLLTLWSPDQDFAQKSRERLVRLIDALREDTEFDISNSDAERIVRDLEDWVKRSDTDAIPRPRLKSDGDKVPDRTVPLHLDELLMLSSVTEDLFYDKVYNGKVILGLESVLTIWTSLGLDPGDPAKVQRQQAQAQLAGNKSGDSVPAPPVTPTPAASPTDPNAPPPQPEGEGIRINLNFAPRPVLRCLFGQDRIADDVINAIIKRRNEVDEDAAQKDAEKAGDTASFGDLRLGQDKKLKFFAQVSDLEQLPEFANLPDPQLKVDFEQLLTTKSDVFSVHMASLFKRSEQNRAFVLLRSRSVVMRRDNGSDGYLHPLVLCEERHGLRIKPVDLQDDYVDRGVLYDQMDNFAQEEQAWNPFLIDFYLSKEQRQMFYRPGR